MFRSTLCRSTALILLKGFPLTDELFSSREVCYYSVRRLFIIEFAGRHSLLVAPSPGEWRYPAPLPGVRARSVRAAVQLRGATRPKGGHAERVTTFDGAAPFSERTRLRRNRGTRVVRVSRSNPGRRAASLRTRNCHVSLSACQTLAHSWPRVG